MKKKVLMFLQSGVGGAERVTVTIGKNLDKEKYDVIFCCIGKENDAIEKFIPSDYRIIRQKKRNPIIQIWTYEKIIAKEKPDIVFASVININNKVLLSRLFFPKIKFIIRSDNNLNIFTRVQQKIIQVTYRLADYIIAQTDEMAEGLIKDAKLDKRKVVILANPIDTSYINAKLENTESPYKNKANIHYVASGRFAESKGFDLLIEAFAIVHKENPQTDLHILGRTGGEENLVFKKVEQLITSNSLSDCITLTGQLENPYPYIKYADCFVLSSRYEGLPNVLLESLYLETPVAAFKCIPAIERIVHNGENGYTANAEDINELSKAMSKAILIGKLKSNYKSASIAEFEKLF